jgi:hypothetical protein
MFIVGAPKCGTTSLYTYLAGHPDVFMSPVKEPIYFAPDMRGGPRRRFQYGDDEALYLGLFANVRNEKVVGEASTRYLASRVAPQLVREFQPQARIVIMLRNPVEMIHALHNERVSWGIEEITDFEAALAADAERAAGRRLRRGADPQWAVYRNAARFGQQVGRWIDAFGRDRVHVIIFDDLNADTPGEFRRLLEFLGVHPSYQPASFAPRHSSHRRRGGPLRAIVQSPLARWASHGLLPTVLGRTRSARLVWRFRQSRLNLKPTPRAPMRPEFRHQLETEFEPEIAHLSRILGRDIVQLWFGRPSETERAADRTLLTVA